MAYTISGIVVHPITKLTENSLNSLQTRERKLSKETRVGDS